MGLYRLLSDTTHSHPDNLAIICGENRYSYSEFKDRVDLLAQGLYDHGVRKDHKIAMIHRNCHCFLEAYFASAKLGAILVPINYRLSPDDFVYILNHSQARLVIGQSDLISWYEEKRTDIPGIETIIVTGKCEETKRIHGQLNYEQLLTSTNRLDFKEYQIDESTGITDLHAHPTDGPASMMDLKNYPISESDIAQIYYTSGTTGKPKGVILTHGNNMVHAQGTIKELDLSSKDCWLHVSPMFHLADAWAVWSVTQVGGTHVVIPSFDAKLVMETIENHKVTLSNFIPTMLNVLVNHPEVNNYNYDSLRLIMSGGAPIAKEVVRKVLDVFACDYIQTYGLTETSPFLTMSILKDWMESLPFEDRLRYMVTTGRPFDGVELKVVRKDGSEVTKDEKEVGEIIVKGETITPGYWRSPETTEERIQDGWLHTRDLAVVNQEGYVTIVDRMDDMIITGGENVYSTEVEDVLYAHPDIFEAAVIGLPDPKWGERVVAVVVLKDGGDIQGVNSCRKEEAHGLEVEGGMKEDGRTGLEGGGEGRIPTEEGIIRFCKERIAHFKAPKSVYFMDELPKTGSAKVYKYKLREMLSGK